jgi:hypothetical protein
MYSYCDSPASPQPMRDWKLSGKGEEKWKKEGTGVTSGLLGKIPPSGLAAGTESCLFPSQNLNADMAGC